MTTADTGRSQITDLLILLSRVTFTINEQQRAEELCSVITDWQLFTDLTIRHGVAALVWQNIVDMQLEIKVSEPERQILEGIRIRAIARVTYIASAAGEILYALEKAGIRALLLKGLALEHSVYGSRGLRQMSDADLLVAPDDALRARDILKSLGFISRPLKSPLYRHIILDVGNHLPEMHRGGVSVDLHHRLFGPCGAEMTARAICSPYEVMVGGRTCFMLPPRIAFLSMVKHIQKHEDKGEFQLRLYCDIYLVLKHNLNEVLCNDLLDEARQAGIECDVRELLYLMKFLYDIKVPDEYITGINQDSLIIKRFLVNLETPGCMAPLSPREVYLKTLRSFPGLKRKLIFIAGDLFPSISFMKKRYGCRTVICSLLHYPHRLGKLIWAAGTLVRD